MSLARVALYAIAVVVAANCESNESEVATRYLQKYGYLDNDLQRSSSGNTDRDLRQAVELFQEYYRLPGNGELNEETLNLMRKPRCGVEDVSERTYAPLGRKWSKTHLRWNFHLATTQMLKTARAAFDLWTANSSLTFERDSQNPDILISFREGLHTYAGSRSDGMCSADLDGRGGVLAHAFYPTGDVDFVSEVHVDRAEPWHIYLTDNPAGTQHLLQTLTHEIGHALGLMHTPNPDAVMYAFAPDKSFPVKLGLEDVLSIQHLYGAKKSTKFPRTTTTAPPTTTTAPPPPTTTTTPPPTTTTTTTKTTTVDVETDLCALRRPDVVLVSNGRLYVAHERRIWSVDLDGKTYKRPMLLTDYMNFLPENFTRLTAAYETPSGSLVLFADRRVYMVTYPRLALVPTWPRSYAELGIPADARINAVVSTNKGRTFVIYNDQIVGEMDDCSMRIVKFYTIEKIFPGIPSGVTLAFRYTDGNLYFVGRKQFYRFNDFARTVTAAGRFDLGILGVACPRDGLLQQLRDLLNRFVRIDALASGDNLSEEREERETER